MEKYFERCLAEIEACENPVEVRVRVIVGLRILLQQSVFGLLEWVGRRAPDPSLAPPKKVVDALWKPADGSLVDAFDALLISAEQTGWSGVSRILLKSSLDRPAAELCRKHPKTLLGLLRAMVELRNDGGEGHGLIGGYLPVQELDALRFMVETLRPVLPRIQETGPVKFGMDADVIELNFLREWQNRPALIRRVQRIASDRVRVYCQVSDGSGIRSEFSYDAVNVFADFAGTGLPSLVEWQNDWGTQVFLPDRKTDSFTGRGAQLDELLDWYEDEEARACLVYGDGGFGKTTLAIEFVHRVLDQDIAVKWRPRVVVFYTAKRTQWSLNGLEPLKSGQPHLIELLANLNVLLFGGYPDPDFYRLEFPAAVSQFQSKMISELNLKRRDVWLIIDNTETLMSDDQESRGVGRELKEVARRIGRVLLTSRRKEHLEATPIEVPVLEMGEAIAFVKDRSSKLKCQLGVNAAAEDLQKEIERIERRPIVLEAFVGALCDPAVRKIDRATDRVARMLNKDLGDFLFADVWGRISLQERRVLLLMARVADVHQSYSLKVCCEEVGITVSTVERVLEESGGIASVVTMSGDVQIGFSKNFLDFSRDKKVTLEGGGVSPTDTEVGRVTGKVSAVLRNASRYKSGPGDQAFRTPLAKAAEIARREGEFDESYRLFEQAVASDSTNGHLRERFAFFLFSAKQDMEGALHQAKLAVELLPDQAEIWFMRGLVEARQGDVRACEISLAKAEELGVSWYRCSVQKSWAYLKSRPPQLPLARKELLRLDTYLQSKGADKRISSELVLLKRRLQALGDRASKPAQSRSAPKGKAPALPL